MESSKFERSCEKFKQSMTREKGRNKCTKEIDPPWKKSTIKITSVESNLPRLYIQDLLSTTVQSSDILKNLVVELGIDDGQNNDRIGCLVREILPKIRPIQTGRRTSFKKLTSYGMAEIYIRCSLDVWILLQNIKLIFPKPRNDMALDDSI